MLDLIQEMAGFPFMVRAFIVGIIVALCASILGVSMVLKRYSMIGDGLSHVAFGSLAIATVLNVAPMSISMPVVVVTAFLLLRINANSSIKGDSAIAIISTGSLAVGVMAISMSTGLNTDVCNYLFGSILGVRKDEMYFTIVIGILVLIVFILSYNRLFAVTFDENFSRATGVRVDAYNALLALLTAFTIVLGMRTMGALLISSMIIFPTLSAMRLCKRFKTVVLTSAIISVSCFIVGLFMSYLISTPTGASVSILNILVFIVFSIINMLKRLR